MIANPAINGAPPVVRIEAVDKTYNAGQPGEVKALRAVSLRINGGEFVAIMGPSGSGKTTLMNIIGCLDTPSSGSYWCGGVDVATLNAAGRAELRLRQIGFVFQGFHLLPRQNALDNVTLPLIYAGVPRAQRLARARAALDQVG
ncbi:MAG: macrolide ABC transporter ATP-binding protein, partial [Lysobacterales bacterium CG_4_9_14_3_um_filter_62_6]